MDFMVDAFLCLVLDVFGLASIESAVPSPSVGLISGAGAQRLRSRFTLLSRLAPRVGLVAFRQTFVRRCQNCVVRASMSVGLAAFACFDLGDGGFE
jgi:hypothetical protein